MRVRIAVGAVACLIAAAAVVSSPARQVVAALPNGSWTMYHRDHAHTGFDSTQPTATTASAGWGSPGPDGTVYGEPLLYNRVVFVGALAGTGYAPGQATRLASWWTNAGAPPSTLSGQCG